MKKYMAALLVFCLLVLGACETVTPVDELTDAPYVTRVYATNPPWPKKPAPMEPVQVGQMLYTFEGSKPYKHEWGQEGVGEYPVFYLGLVDQDGKLVAKPQYETVEYTHDTDGRIAGLIAIRGDEITRYQLDGTSQKLKIKGYSYSEHGHYAVINKYAYDSDTADQKLCEGLYDLDKEQFVFEMQDEQRIRSWGGETAIVETPDGQVFYDFAQGTQIEIPQEIGLVQSYNPETGLFGVYKKGERDAYYNRDFKLVEYISDRQIYSPFSGREYAIMYDYNSGNPVYHIVNRKGEVLYTNDQIERLGDLFVIGNSQKLLDNQLHELAPTKDGKRLIALYPTIGYDYSGFLLLDKKLNVTKSFGLDGKPITQDGVWRNYNENTVCKLKDGKWTVLDLAQFVPKIAPKDMPMQDGIAFARDLHLSEKYIILSTGVGVETDIPGILLEIFAVDWNGKRTENAPLLPHYKKAKKFLPTAGEQGPNYYWIEQEGKRGYVNTDGQWLFVDETGL